VIELGYIAAMQIVTFLVHLILSVVLIVGTYQFYFLTQRHQFRAARVFHFALDEKIPFISWWSWVYSFLYYPAILFLNWIVQSGAQFTMMAFSFMVLLGMQMAAFYFFPVATPEHWRSLNKGKSYSERFLLFVQKFDKSSNCFPSMHVSVAMLTALHAAPTVGPWSYLFPVLIAISCVFTKQHYLVDLPFGAILGVIAYGVYAWLIAL
jgi:membrane-associated phospholipid phosphatase